MVVTYLSNNNKKGDERYGFWEKSQKRFRKGRWRHC